MFSPIAGAGFRGSVGFPAGIPGGGMSPAPSLGANLTSSCSCGDGFSPSSELLSGGLGNSFVGGLSPFAGLGSGALSHPGFGSGGLSHPGFSDLSSLHPWAGGLPDESLPASLMGEGDPVAGFASLLGGGADPAAGFTSLLSGGGAFPSLAGSGGFLATQALMAQAAAGEQNQAALMGAQSGAYGGLVGAQGTALAGLNPLMSGLAANYG